jgi:hypothetical protein
MRQIVKVQKQEIYLKNKMYQARPGTDLRVIFRG